MGYLRQNIYMALIPNGQKGWDIAVIVKDDFLMTKEVSDQPPSKSEELDALTTKLSSFDLVQVPDLDK